MMTSNSLIGVGLRQPHYAQILQEKPPIGWFEVHSENFFHLGSPATQTLLEVRKAYPISLHGVGLSLGCVEGVQEQHLERLKALVQAVDPFLVSEHLSWSVFSGKYLPDLLPIPYNQETFEVFSRNIEKTQECLKREILIENPSSYLEYKSSDQEEASFLAALCESTGAKLLLDINNIYVSSLNHGWDAMAYLEAIPRKVVAEIHLAGHSVKRVGSNKVLRIDTHDDFVAPEVWGLYNKAIERFGKVYSLLEWDAKIPELSVLVAEALKMKSYLEMEVCAGA